MVNETKAAPAKKEEAAPIKNCASCNKPLKRAKRFYRNGKYYCNKKCAKSAGKPAEEAKDAAPQTAAAEQPKEEKA